MISPNGSLQPPIPMARTDCCAAIRWSRRKVCCWSAWGTTATTKPRASSAAKSGAADVADISRLQPDPQSAQRHASPTWWPIALTKPSRPASAANRARPCRGQAYIVVLRVPPQYRLNTPRFLRIILDIPFLSIRIYMAAPMQRQQRSSLISSPSGRRLARSGRTVVSALRLESLGQRSIPALKKGLKSEHPLVRLCSAEALAYLGDRKAATNWLRPWPARPCFAPSHDGHGIAGRGRLPRSPGGTTGLRPRG